MTVHLPQVSTFFKREEASQLDRMECDFLRSSVVYPEDELPVCERWWRILSVLTEIHGRHLWEDLSDIYETIYHYGRGGTVGACIDFLLLRQRFFMLLADNDIGRAHQNNYEVEASIIWRSKLIDRVADISPADVKEGRYIPAKTEPPSSHKWIQ